MMRSNLGVTNVVFAAACITGDTLCIKC